MRIQVSIAGYSGTPVTLACVKDPATGVLVISKQVKYNEAKLAPDFALVSSHTLAQTDFTFNDEKFGDAVKAYFDQKGQGILVVHESLARFNPDNRIEYDSVDATGRRYRIAPEIDNGQVAVLAVAAFAEIQNHISTANQVADEISGLLELYTI